jgi:long-chain acyl-CoA synthetase
MDKNDYARKSTSVGVPPPFYEMRICDNNGNDVPHPDVLEAAVFGIPSAKWGESPVAAVTLHNTCAVTEEALKTWINENVEAKFQRVQEVVNVESFPRNIAGKVLKRVMREEFANKES